MGILCLIFCLFLVLPSGHGFCFSTFGRVDVTATGRRVPVCEFNGIDFLDGSKFTTTGCNECECKKGHLHCCGIGTNAGVITPRPNCKILKDGCIAREVRISDETLDCVTGKPYRNDTGEVTFPTGATPIQTDTPKPTDTIGGVAVGHIPHPSLSKPTVNSIPNDVATLENIFNTIANNAQKGKRTSFDDLLRDFSSRKFPIQSNVVYPKLPNYPQNPLNPYTSSFQLFDPYTTNDAMSNWLMYNGIMDGGF
ncbi:uncharacterized protein LOC133197328 [Saccostrea echinata]|uniref:uncharacterized protein LOC133197328 n=1 Tax=Saccostrea echinata TaxID=191078 RepID=UPI002A8359EA|nr:uncharacterized protein LOC133197328 [Saccostrea echinata]